MGRAQLANAQLCLCNRNRQDWHSNILRLSGTQIISLAKVKGRLRLSIQVLAAQNVSERKKSTVDSFTLK